MWCKNLNSFSVKWEAEAAEVVNEEDENEDDVIDKKME